MHPINPILDRADYFKIDPLSHQTYQNLAEHNDLIRTSCGHKFSAVALAALLNQEHSCPQCHSHIDPRDNILVIKADQNTQEEDLPYERGSGMIGAHRFHRVHHFSPQPPPEFNVSQYFNGMRSEEQALEEALRASLEQTTPSVSPPSATRRSLEILTEANNGNKINLNVGESVQIRLNSNPSTGYSWDIEEASSQFSCEHAYTGSSPHRCGSGGISTFTIHANTPGEAQLRLGYKRPWEGGSIKTFSLTISIS